MKTTKVIIVLLFISLSLSTYSTTGIFDSVVSIEDIYKNPEKYKNKEIKIKGVVKNSASLFMRSGFIIKDKSDEIFVVVSGKLPPKIDDVATLKGKLVIVGSINNKNFVYFKENKETEKE